MIPGSAPPVDVFPILKYVPEFLASWKIDARRVRQTVVADAWRWVTDGKEQRAKTEADPGSVQFEGLTAKLLKERDSQEDSKGGSFTDLELGYIAQALVGVAVDTTSATFESLMFCFASFPETLRIAQDEVDKVAGTERPPTGEHVSQLPYLKACLYEVGLLFSHLLGMNQPLKPRAGPPLATNDTACPATYAHERRSFRRLRLSEGNYFHCKCLDYSS